MSSILEDISKAVVEGNTREAKYRVTQALKETSPEEILKLGLAKGVLEAKRKYEATHDGFRVLKGVPKTDVFTLHKINQTTKAFEAGWRLLEDTIPENESRNSIILGVLTNKQDHGKNIIRAVLRAAGFAVVDIGNELEPEQVVQAARKHNPDLIALSLMTNAALESLQILVTMLRREQIPANLLIGGIAATPMIANTVEAFYCQDLTDTPSVATKAAEKTQEGVFTYLEGFDVPSVQEENIQDWDHPDFTDFLTSFGMRAKTVNIDELVFSEEVPVDCRECTNQRTGSCPPIKLSQKFSSYTILTPKEFQTALEKYNRAVMVAWPFDFEDKKSREAYRELSDRALELENIGRRMATQAYVLKFGGPCPYCSKCKLLKKGECSQPNKLRLCPEAVNLEIIETAKKEGLYRTGADFYALLLLRD